jgi:hypothetical protein
VLVSEVHAGVHFNPKSDTQLAGWKVCAGRDVNFATESPAELNRKGGGIAPENAEGYTSAYQM